MFKIGLLILLSFSQNQPQLVQDSLGLEDLLREQQVENQLLEREVNLLEEHVKEIRNTVYWALGGVFTLALLFVGVNWFSMNKLYEKDKERLEDDIYDYIDDKYLSTIDHQINTYYSVALNSYRGKDYLNAFYSLMNCLVLIEAIEESDLLKDVLVLMESALKKSKRIDKDMGNHTIETLSIIQTKFEIHKDQILKLKELLE